MGLSGVRKRGYANSKNIHLFPHLEFVIHLPIVDVDSWPNCRIKVFDKIAEVNTVFADYFV